MTTTLLLIRHGQSAGNIEDRLQGWRHSHLTNEGHRQARLLAEVVAREYKLDALHSSPLRRAMETAQAIAEATGLQPIPDPDLREINFGLAEGVRVPDLANIYPETYKAWKNRDDLDFGWPEGETRREFHERIKTAIGAIVERHAGQTVAVVSHGGVLAVYIAHLMTGATNTWGTYIIDNCSLTEVEIDGSGEPSLIRLNECAHEPEGKIYDL